ncbi:hypothetical protein GCM10007423_39890 [Dyadobacter endophyticus]|uniref:SGNH hydrolase-type esterase domain-containing protein n=1 Tax=Dyadobacter endophyticus TaxID=1749036 RepID=A0ABQ1YXZ2_9BACT|nr:SGNH/GDSL hydrolase family protein [Dyadobacter endophyticus]GGH42907.1 hypothetical protein GCM10007423_39890 [Dyadobacter endophyticus]
MTAKRLKSLLSVSFLTISVLISQLSVAQTGTATFRQKINQDLPSNSAKQITASKIRSVFTASADAIDAIYGTISLADRLGTYNATTGVATVSETGATSTPTTTPPVGSKGKYYDVVVAGTNSVTGVSTAWGVGDKIISAGTKWDRIPFAISPKTIGKTELKDAGVTFRKTDLFVPGKNLFNVNDEDNVIGSFIDQTSGALTSNANQNTSHFIDIDPLQNISVSSGNAFGCRVIWYDSNKTFISGALIGTVWAQAPSNAEFMRVSVNITSLTWSTLQVEKGTNQTNFEPFKGILNTSSGSSLVSNALSETFPLSANNLHLVPGKNLFNLASADNFLGRFINGKQIDAVAGYNVTHVIPVIPGHQYTVSYKHNIAWYDQNKVYLSQSLSSDASKTQTAPASAYYMRCTVALASWSTFQVEEGSLQTSFEAYTLNYNSVGSVPVKIIRSRLADTANVASFAATILPTSLLSATNLNYVIGKNRFNPNDADVLIGQFIQYNNGIPFANATYNSTGYIPVTAGQSYTLSYKHQIAWYDANKVYISGSNFTDANKTQTAPAGAAYLRCSVLATSWSTFQVESGSSQTSYEAYAYYIDKVGIIPVLPKHAKLADSSAVASISHTVAPTSQLSATNLNYTFGKNLANPNDPDVLLGSFIQYNNGIPAANASYNSTGFIPVTAGQTYTLSFKHQIAWYNSSKVYISGSNSSDVNKNQTAPAGAAYLRATVALASWSTFQVELGSSQTAFESFAYYIDKIGTIPVIPKNTLVKAESITAPVLAPKIYIPRQKELSIYFENLCRYYETEGKARTEITLSGVPTTELTVRGRSIKWKQLVGNTSLTAISGSVKSYGKDYDLLNTLNFTIQPVDQNLTTAKKVMNIGDSFTLRETFVDKVNNGASATGLTFHGMRTSTQSSPTVNHEGRGGWTMTSYHTVSTTLFSPFMQPQSPYKYYGNTSYWIAAIANPTNAGNTNYDAGYVDAAIRALYDGTSGLLLAPATNDVMYVNSASEYRRWDGSAWVAVTGLTFTFNFAKYRTLYSCPTIDIAHVLLGTNDFSVTDPAGFTSIYSLYKTRMDAMITSFKADNASIKVVIGIPVSSGRQGDYGVVETERRKMAYWLLAKNLITDYGGREAEGIVVADYHSTVDRIYGFDPQPVLPFADYSGTLRELNDLDYVHLSPDGFKQMGDIYMGAIQSLR